MLQRVQDGLATPMDLDIISSVQDQIMGNCLCVLGDAMAMPVSSMVNKFREEFERHIEEARSKHATLDEAMLADELDIREGIPA
jgi:NADH-quinone oxidoreductase subunit F